MSRYKTWLKRRRQQSPLGFWPFTKHRIDHFGFYYVVFQGRRYVGKTRRYLSAIKLAQDSGAR